MMNDGMTHRSPRAEHRPASARGATTEWWSRERRRALNARRRLHSRWARRGECVRILAVEVFILVVIQATSRECVPEGAQVAPHAIAVERRQHRGLTVEEPPNGRVGSEQLAHSCVVPDAPI